MVCRRQDAIAELGGLLFIIHAGHRISCGCLFLFREGLAIAPEQFGVQENFQVLLALPRELAVQLIVYLEREEQVLFARIERVVLNLQALPSLQFAQLATVAESPVLFRAILPAAAVETLI
jgi:hypothetical protein